MIEYLSEFFYQIWQILLELSPSLLLGLLVAGALQAFLPSDFLSRRMKKRNSASVFKAVLFGIPIPLCSCGVIPATLALYRQGASKGASTGFLISTPQTGVDSILVTASFLGWPFTLFKLGAAFISGMAGGMIVNIFDRDKTGVSEGISDRENSSATSPAAIEAIQGIETEKSRSKITQMIQYGVYDILGAIDSWLIFGVLVSALISILVPQSLFSEYSWSQGILGVFLVLLISTPLYVCTTGSVPIAASLIAAGLPAGSALVFLMAGPATNVATIGAVYKSLGKRVAIFYLLTVILFSSVFALFFDSLLSSIPVSQPLAQHGAHLSWLSIGAAILLIMLLVYLRMLRIRNYINFKKLGGSPMDMNIQVDGMTCMHCVSRVKVSLENHPAIQEATPDLGSGKVVLKMEEGRDKPDMQELDSIIDQAGYKLVQ